MNTKSQSKKESLFEKLRRKMAANTGSCSSDEEGKQDHIKKKKKNPKCSAINLTRQIELGWFHNGRQVGLSSGGGKRIVRVPKLATKSNLIELSVSVFEKGLHKRGLVGDFKKDILDYAKDAMPGDVTVGDILDILSTSSRVSFYLSTTSAVSASQQENPENSAADDDYSLDNDVGLESHSFSREIGEVTIGETEMTTDPSEASLPDLRSLQGRVESSTASEIHCLDTVNYIFHNPNMNASYSENTINMGERFCLSGDLSKTAIGLTEVDVCCTSSSNNHIDDPAQESACTTEMVGTDILEVQTVCSSDVSDIDSLNVCDTNQEAPDKKTLSDKVSDGDAYTDSQKVTNLLNDSTPEPDISDSKNAATRSDEIPQVHVVDAENVANVCINRTRIQEDMVTTFKNYGIIDFSLRFKFKNELGQDADGVSHDAYSGFWNSFFNSNADGERSRIPILTPEYGFEEWCAVGRILAKGFLDHKYFPTLLSPAYALAITFGEEAVTPEILKDSFLKYLSEMEADVVESAIKNEQYDEDTLIDILDRAQCHTLPSEFEMVQAILQVAHKTIIQESKYALDAISDIAQVRLIQHIPTVKDLLVLYEALKPTQAKVVKLLHCNPASKEESLAFSYLTHFIRGQNDNELKKLLRLLTGADVICVDQIEVNFVIRHGTSRIPTAHTCGPLLELPSNYLHFPDFRAEWENILQNVESMTMNVA